MKRLITANFTKIISNQQKLIVEDFYANEGEIIGITGDNGSGKTTFLKILLDLAQPTKGKVTISPIISISSALDLKQLYTHLTGRQILRTKLYLENSCEKKIDQYISLFQMEKYIDKKISTYSLGMKKKILLSSSFILDNEVYFLDEPTNGLSPNFLPILSNVLRELKKKGKTIILVSHDYSFIQTNSDRIYNVNEERLLEVSKNKSTFIYLKVDDSYKAINHLKNNDIFSLFQYKITDNFCFTMNCPQYLIPTLVKYLVENDIKMYALNDLDDWRLHFEVY